MRKTIAFAATAPLAEDPTEPGSNWLKDSKTSSSVLHRTIKIPPRQVTSADGKYLTFSDGHTILDSTCGAAVACIGYNDKRVKRAMMDQMDKFAYCNSMFFGHPVGEELASELIQGTCGVMSKAYIMCSGKLSSPVRVVSLTRRRLRGYGVGYEDGSSVFCGTEPQAE